MGQGCAPVLHEGLATQSTTQSSAGADPRPKHRHSLRRLDRAGMLAALSRVGLNAGEAGSERRVRGHEVRQTCRRPESTVAAGAASRIWDSSGLGVYLQGPASAAGLDLGSVELTSNSSSPLSARPVLACGSPTHSQLLFQLPSPSSPKSFTPRPPNCPSASLRPSQSQLPSTQWQTPAARASPPSDKSSSGNQTTSPHAPCNNSKSKRTSKNRKSENQVYNQTDRGPPPAVPDGKESRRRSTRAST